VSPAWHPARGQVRRRPAPAAGLWCRARALRRFGLSSASLRSETRIVAKCRLNGLTVPPLLASFEMRGRNHQTTPLAVERAALELFAEKGFDNTTVDEVAAAAGISRRTFFNYFTSKNDIPWSQFGSLLEDLDAWLSELADDVPMLDAIAEATVRFNRFASDGP